MGVRYVLLAGIGSDVALRIRKVQFRLNLLVRDFQSEGCPQPWRHTERREDKDASLPTDPLATNNSKKLINT